MNTDPQKPQPPAPLVLPLFPAAATLSIAALVAWGLNVLLLPLFLPAAAGYPPVIAFAVFAAWCASVIGLVPLRLMSPLGDTGVMYGYLFGTGARLLMVAGFFVFAASAYRDARDILIISLISTYLVLLAVDIAFICRYLSTLPGPKKAGDKPAPMSEGPTPPEHPKPPEVTT